MDKSSSDVAAEGAILNEMLEIVAKRAALRPSDSLQDGVPVDGIESDVSAFVGPPTSTLDWVLVFGQFILVYACILYFAFNQS